MKRTIILLTALAAGAAIASPALAWGARGGSVYYGSSSTSGGSTTSGGTQVPEPGVLGIMGLGLIGLGLARRRKARD
jgi:hypothetical protein